MDIAIRAGEGIGGTRRDAEFFLRENRAGSEAFFYRGKGPRDCHPGERVFFLENGLFHGYAVFHEYGWRRAQPGSGRSDGDAIVVRPPYVSIDPPLRPPDDFCRGRWPWRYIDRHPETARLLRNAGL